ncbi:hypothetical protein EsH8_VI_000383 [Colletotrichum jinshuiense]
MATKMKVLAAPYSPLTHPPIDMDKLEVGSLYIMISVPLPIYLGRKKHTYATAVPEDSDFPFCTYEAMVSEGLSAEEFHWDLYWHISDSAPTSPDGDGGCGVIYRLRQLRIFPPTHAYDRVDVIRVRSHAQLVGLVRVLKVPTAVIPHLTRYLDWMTKEFARVAQRSYVWASMAYYRTRCHLLKGNGVRDHTFNQFDISRFTAEMLSFAYKEVPSALELDGAAAPRPVVMS